MKFVGLIPARGGSKGIPDKNIRLLCGKPLIAYTIEAALASKILDRVIVSTDSPQIAKIAIKYGAEAPFLRPSEIATDDTPDRPVMEHLIHWLQQNDNYCFDYLTYLRPTTPLKTSILIDEALKKIVKNPSYSGLRSVTKAEGVHHPYWMYKIDSGQLQPFIDTIDVSNYYQRQLLPHCYRINGVVDIVNVNSVLSNEKYLYGKKVTYYEIEEHFSIDIDTTFDLLLCEFILKNSL